MWDGVVGSMTMGVVGRMPAGTIARNFGTVGVMGMEGVCVTERIAVHWGIITVGRMTTAVGAT